MIDLQGIFGKLLGFFEASPTGTRAEFEAGVVVAGVATAGEVAVFVDRFLDIGDWMGLIPSDNFDALMAKAAAVGLAKARNGARAIYDRLVKLVDFRIYAFQDKLDQLRPLLSELTVTINRATTGRAWLVANGPAGDVKTATLAAIDEGLVALTARKQTTAQVISELEAQIVALGGTPT